MHTIASLIAIVGAGHQSKSIHTTHIDTADMIIGLLGIQFAEDMLVAQSPVQKIPPVLEDKETIAHSSMPEEGHKVRRPAFLMVLEKRKVCTVKKISLVPDADTEYMKKLLHRVVYLVAFREENGKACQELKTPAMTYCTSEDFDAIFPPLLQYISKGWAQDISDNVWEELFPRN